MRVPTYQSTQTAQVVRQPKASGRSPYPSLYRAGSELQNIGSLLAQRKMIQNEADAANGYNAYVEEEITYRNELKAQKKGVEARSITDDYKTWHNDTLSRIKEKYTHNPETEAIFSRLAQKHYLSKIGSLAQYMAGEERAYNQSVLNRDIQNIEAEAVDDPYAVIETPEGEVLAIEDRINSYHRKAALLMGGAYTDDVAGDIEAKMKVSALTAMVSKDPTKIGPILDRWKVDIGSKAYAQFKKAAQEEIVKKQVDTVYDTARNMDITDAEDYINASGLPTNKRRELIRNVRSDFDRKQKEIEKQQKEIINQNSIDSLEAYYNNTLSERDLDTLAEGQQIDRSVYKFIKDQIKKGETATEDNPEIVADIAARVELKDYKTAYDLMKDALGKGQIKGTSYINLTKSIAGDQVSDAIGYINRAMQPSEFEFDPYKRQKHADAIVDLSVRMATGENPLEAAKEIVRLNKSTVATSLSRYRYPRFMLGKKDDPAALREARDRTLEAYKSEQITPEEFKREMELIQNIEFALAERTRLQETDEDIDKNLKGVKVGR